MSRIEAMGLSSLARSARGRERHDTELTLTRCTEVHY
jgi:hypothetical protein